MATHQSRVWISGAVRILQSSTDQDTKVTAVRIRGNTGQRLEQHVGMLVALMILLAWVGGMSMRANVTSPTTCYHPPPIHVRHSGSRADWLSHHIPHERQSPRPRTSHRGVGHDTARHLVGHTPAVARERRAAVRVAGWTSPRLRARSRSGVIESRSSSSLRCATSSAIRGARGDPVSDQTMSINMCAIAAPSPRWNKGRAFEEWREHKHTRVHGLGD
jgi:hypothetical protein